MFFNIELYFTKTLVANRITEQKTTIMKEQINRKYLTLMTYLHLYEYYHKLHNIQCPCNLISGGNVIFKQPTSNNLVIIYNK